MIGLLSTSKTLPIGPTYWTTWWSIRESATPKLVQILGPAQFNTCGKTVKVSRWKTESVLWKFVAIFANVYLKVIILAGTHIDPCARLHRPPVWVDLSMWRQPNPVTEPKDIYSNVSGVCPRLLWPLWNTASLGCRTSYKLFPPTLLFLRHRVRLGCQVTVWATTNSHW